MRLLALMLALGAGLAAQQAYPLREIVIEGAESLSAETIIAATGLKLGSPVTEADFQKGLRRLTDVGLFETVEYAFSPKGDGYQLTYRLVEVQNLYTVSFQGFDDSDEELTRLLEEKIPLYIGKAPGDGVMVIRIGNTLQARWREGGGELDIVGQLIPGDGERLVMLFRPKVRIQNISFVTFEGSEAIEVIELQRRFNPIAMGEEYSDARLNELLIHNVRPWFEEHGRMDVKFCPCSSEPDPKTEGVLVKIQVEDGPVYSWGQVDRPEIGAGGAKIDKRKMDRIFAFADDPAVNMQTARSAQSALDEELRKQGFLKVRSEIEIQINNQSRRVRLVYSLEPGTQYRFQRLEIEGLDILSEPVIRKRWGLKPGTPFNPSYASYFLDRIKVEQMFDLLEETRFYTQIDEARKTVDVTLVFFGKEAKKKRGPAYKVDKSPFP